VNRRRFLAATAGALATACAGPAAVPRAPGTAGAAGRARIDRIELFPVRYPMAGWFKFFAGPRGSTGRAAVIVKVTADDGTVGWGQSVPISKWSDETPETALLALREYFAPALLGCDAEDLEAAHAAMDAAIAPGFSTGMPIARAGLDLALHDGIGRRRGQSLAQLWGRPAPGPLALSWTVNVQRLDEVGPLVQQGRERGYEHCNIKVGPDPDFDAALARAVRALVPRGFLWADANGGYAVEQALRAAPLLADAGVDVLEAPLRPNEISGWQQLRRQGALPILMDEGVVSPTDLREFHALGMLDGMSMKPSRCGGLVSCRRQIEYCAGHGLMWLGSGLTDPDISLAASLQLYGAHGLQRPAALNGPQFVVADVLRAPLRIERGRAFVPDGPGLGIDVDEAEVRELAARSG
jgi:L-alanine-DL-glutamate epimerase-like enolase superfamily enzyme